MAKKKDTNALAATTAPAAPGVVVYRRDDGDIYDCVEGSEQHRIFEKSSRFERVTEDDAAEIDDLPGTPPVTYTEDDALAQNDGVDVSSKAKK